MLKRMMNGALAMGLTGLLLSAHGARADSAAKDPAAAADDAVVQKLTHGEINWSKKTVTATGSGVAGMKITKDSDIPAARLMAERAAKMDALRNILETVQGIQVTGSRSANDIMSNGDVKTRIEGMVRGFRVVDTKYYSDGSVDVVVQMLIDENLTNALIEKPKAGKAPRSLNTVGPESFTGLVINARGLGVVPSMSPRIVDESGKEIYAADVVSEKGLAQGGIASYEKTEEQSKGRTGNKPLVVKALRLIDKSKTDIVVSNGDADKLRSPNLNLSFLAEGKVVILVD
ncbi:MAG: hypothetical protein FJ137_09445 [Deltaproteobacteria bacterium]|nr:hypothetical protein [Deltaproteobacteria bacterium]